MITPISGVTASRRQDPELTVEMFVRPLAEGGDNNNDGLAEAQHPTIPRRGPLLTAIEARHRIPDRLGQAFYVVDITGVDETLDQNVAIDVPSSGDPSRLDFPAPDHHTHLTRAPLTIRARPSLVHTFTAPLVVAEPVHDLVTVQDSPSPGWTVNEHRGRMIAGASPLECGAIIRNTADTITAAYTGGFSSPVQILEPGASLTYGPASAGLEFNSGLTIAANGESNWQWVRFRIPAGNPSFGVRVIGGGAMTFFQNCSFEGLSLNGPGPVDIDGCYHDGRDFGWNGADGDSQRSAFVGVNMVSHAGSTFTFGNRYEQCGPLGTGGTEHYSGTTQIEQCEHLDGTGNGIEAQGQGRHTITRTVISRASLDGVVAVGPVRVVLGDVQGADNARHGLSARKHAEVEVRNGTAISGTLGDVEAGSLGVRTWAQTPIRDFVASAAEGVSIHDP